MGAPYVFLETMKPIHYLISVLAAVALWLLVVGPPAPESPRPSLNTVIATSSRVAAGDAESTYLERLVRDSEDLSARVDLAQHYLLEARRTLDETRFVPLARTHLELALDSRPDDYRARVLMATLQNKLHRFEESERMARALIAEHPGHAYNYGTLVDALVELGRYDEAVEAMDRMLALRPDLTSYSRASYLRELMGDDRGALRAMEMAAQAGAQASEGRSWAITKLAGFALAEGRADHAEQLLIRLLDEEPNYAAAMNGLVQVYLYRPDLAQARLWMNRTNAATAPGTFAETEAELLWAEGQNDTRASEAVLEGLLEAQDMGENVRMELADFYADQDHNLDEALWLSSLELDRRPDHLHANETYAWVLFRLGRFEEAIPYINHARRFDNGDAKATFRAARIYIGAGRVAEGHALLGQALEENLKAESPSAAAQARRLLDTR